MNADVVEFAMGEEVYHRADSEPEKGIVTGILFRPSGHVFYITWPGRDESLHYAMELTREKKYAVNEE